ncbi:sensor histidine kinase [Anaeromyxobacter sp. Fw109-5]|uniref:sensor histidine kinase n=1 Tax=Anaeromyxobacter sp. (strain Fw109-5) TaxID=404589 RepID=UPI00059B67EA|nr:protoglobin domain-containing protein [Anaeromyxobacter sp. Fw109-5]
MPETVFEELKRYVGWGDGDERALRSLHGAAAPHFPRLAEEFYDRILGHEGARTALVGGESQVGHLKVTMIAWLDELLGGPWDEAYWDRRYRIGRVHVRIGLPQHYMFGAMNVHRTGLARLAYERFHGDPPELERVRNALGKVLDLELAVMLHTYREDLLAQQARVERLSTFGQLVGSIGHDLRNPLGVIETSLYILRTRTGEDERARKHLDRIGEQLGVANGIITNLLDMIRDRPLAREPVELAAVVGGAAESVRRPTGVSLALEGLDALPPVEGDPGQLRQVFVNLLENAVFAASPEGVVAVRASRADGLVALDVEDSGPGVDPATRRRLFEPLITTKDKGIGLGLALVKRIAERHGGTVEYSDRPGGGARFTVRLPA